MSLKRILAASVISSAWLGTASATPSADPLPPQNIVNGTTDTGDPSVVEIAVGCTGTVIAPRVVLTARHCVEGSSLRDLEVFFGNDISKPGTTIEAVGSEMHPDVDIAVIMLASDAPSPPIPVNSEDLAGHVGETVRPVGFGTTSEHGPDEFGIKRHGTTKLDHVDAELMYIGVDPSATWTCYGDSGGPHFMKFGGVEKVVGVTSFGTAACGEPDDAEVRTDPFYAWIAGFIGDQPANPDAGPITPDAGPNGPAPDAGGNGENNGDDDGGCGCVVGGSGAGTFAPGLALVGLAFVLVRRRRTPR